ncbi:MAG: hypothetical protein WC955_07635 [Elusimicrobiota bacterium]
MIKKILSADTAIVCLLTLMLCGMCVFTIHAVEFEYGAVVSPGELSYSDDKKKDEPPRVWNKYCYLLSKEFGAEPEYVQKLFQSGYGYSELTQMFVISRMSKNTVKDIVVLREKNKKFESISGTYKLDYKEVLKEAVGIRAKLMARKDSVILSTTTYKVITE